MTMQGTGIDFRKSALIVWDVQNGIAKESYNFVGALDNILTLIDAYHKAKLPVIISQQTGLPYEKLTKFMLHFQAKKGMDPRVNRMAEGSDNWKLVDKLIPAKTDIVMTKNTPNFFVGTMLDPLLRNLGVDVLVLTGFRTDVGIDSTARYASDVGYIPVVVEDACGGNNKELHDHSLAVLKNRIQVESTKQVLEHLNR